MNEVIHYCNYANQPYVQIACTGLNEYAWGSGRDLPLEVYETEDGSLYTFEEKNVTCEACKKLLMQK
jgi:hypothetical protein